MGWEDYRAVRVHKIDFTRIYVHQHLGMSSRSINTNESLNTSVYAYDSEHLHIHVGMIMSSHFGKLP